MKGRDFALLTDLYELTMMVTGTNKRPAASAPSLIPKGGLAYRT